MLRLLKLIVFLYTTAVFADNAGRIDINGKSSKITMKIVKTSGCNASSQPDRQYIYNQFSGVPGKWTERKLCFIPESSGIVQVWLMGPYRKDESSKIIPNGCYYDDIKVNGKLITNGNFENGAATWFLQKSKSGIPAEIINNKNIVQNGNKCVLVWHNAKAIRNIEVNKGERTEISFKFRPAGVLKPENVFFPLSLKNIANMGFTDSVADDGKGGWTDQGPDNDLSSFDYKRKEFGSIPYSIINPAKNNGRSCVIFKSSHSKYGIKRVEIPVGRECNMFAFLNACAWGNIENIKAAEVTAVYTDGHQEMLNFVTGVNTGDWWVKAVPKAEIVWKSGSLKNGSIGIYQTIWKLKRPGEITKLIIKSTDENTIWGLIGLTGGMIYSDPSLKMTGEKFSFPVNSNKKYTAININSIKLKMKESSPEKADAFFDLGKSVPKMYITDPDGKCVKAFIVKFKRAFPPLLLLKSTKKKGNYTINIGDKENPDMLISPREALKKLTGLETVNYNLPELNQEGLLFSSKDMAKSTGIKEVANIDSFFINAVNFTGNSCIELKLNLHIPQKLRLMIYSCKPIRYANYVWLELNGKKLKIGGNSSKPSFNWQGGQTIDLPKGNTLLRIFPGTYMKDSQPLLKLGYFLLSDNKRIPYTPGFPDELDALRKAGFHVISDSILKKDVAVTANKYFSTVAEDKSFPDLSYMTGHDIVKEGFMHTSGDHFVYDSGKLVPMIWGCNFGRGSLYNSVMPDRMGEEFLDIFLKRLKRMGYDTIRHMPFLLRRRPGTNQNNELFPLLSVKPLIIENYFYDNIWKLLAGCRKNNLHLFYTLWHSNSLFYGLGGIKDRNSNSCIVFFYPEAKERLKKVCRKLLTTPNPYNGGIAPVNDPTLSIIEIENERNFLEKWNISTPSDWRNLPEDARSILYHKWAEFLKNKYKTFDTLKENYGSLVLKPNCKENLGFEAIEFPPAWDVKLWGHDNSKFNIKMDDLRVTSASFGKNNKSSVFASDGLEFMYVIYRDFLVEMKDFLRNNLGYKGIIYSNGADTEVHYSQRLALTEVGDAVSGGTGYWNREGYGFLQNFNWLAPLVYTANNDKPVISREYGANLTYKNCWWGNLITATVQQYLGSSYLFNFNLGLGDYSQPDYLYPSDDINDNIGHINLSQDAHIYSHFANLASVIAMRSNDIKASDFKVDIALPYDNTFYAAPFRGYNKLTIKDYRPFLYTSTRIRSFKEKYDGNANLITNEPSLPFGDYSKAKNLFLSRPHSSLSRNGNNADKWFKDKKFQADGFLDTPKELDAFYDAMKKSGIPIPVSRKDFCEIWRNVDKSLEINSNKLFFNANLPDFGAFIGKLDNAIKYMPRQFNATGQGESWIFSGNYGSKLDKSIFMAVMNGIVDIRNTKPLDYIFIGSDNIEIRRNGSMLIKLSAPESVNIALSTSNGKDLLKATEVYLTFFRPKSCITPASVSLKLNNIAIIEACNMQGKTLKHINLKNENGICTFNNPWENGNKISYLRIKMKNHNIGQLE